MARNKFANSLAVMGFIAAAIATASVPVRATADELTASAEQTISRILVNAYEVEKQALVRDFLSGKRITDEAVLRLLSAAADLRISGHRGPIFGEDLPNQQIPARLILQEIGRENVDPMDAIRNTELRFAGSRSGKE